MDKRIERFNVTITGKSLEIDTVLAPITAEMNETPLVVNKETWAKNLAKITSEKNVAVKLCRDVTGEPLFAPNSLKDCAREFVDKRGLSGRLTKTGATSIDKDQLIRWEAGGDKLALIVRAARELITKESQLKAWKQYAEAGSVQPTWDQNGTPMARYTSDEPCLQNRIVEIRETIEPLPGYSFVSTDLGQAEYVGWGSLSGDPLLAEIFTSGKDLHVEMFERLKDKAPGLNMRGETPRQLGKTINFALLYLMTDGALAGKLGISRDEAKAIMAAYEAIAPKAVQYRTDYLAQCAERGFTETKWGYRRFMAKPDGDQKSAVVHDWEKTSWHHHNSGSAAEILKQLTVWTMKAVRDAGITGILARPCLNLHDELILMVRDDKVEQVKRIMVEQFSQQIEGFLLFKIDCRTGKTWLEISK